jgi:acyl-CoA reductase-like NAD-dependent aldehyde dehydrogenase
MINPATGASLGTLEETSPEKVALIMEKARKAFLYWSQVPVSERVKYLKKMRKYILEQGENLAKEIVTDTGKPLLEAYLTEIFTVMDFLKYYEKYAEKFLKTKRKKTPVALLGKKSYVQYRPMGVIAIISPWNYPFQLSMVPVISALIAGNAVILKPSEVTAYTGLTIEKVLKATEFPDGVVQVLHGGKAVGQALVDAKPDKIFFTGSTATGKKIMASAAQNLIPVELELGGKDPMIIFEDANLERAVNGAIWGAFTNAGQVCMSVERVYVQEKIYDEFVDRVVKKTKELRNGTGLEAEIGYMVSPEQVKIVKEHLDEAVEKGAKILTGGKIIEGSMIIPPTVIVNVSHGMKIIDHETFGPILPIMPFKTEDEAINLANSSTYGLNASVWSNDLARARRVANRIESGNICINDVIVSVANPHLPFGGIKESGMGRYHGAEGLYTFCHITSLIEDPGKKNKEINWYPYSVKKFKLFTHLSRFLFK